MIRSFFVSLLKKVSIVKCTQKELFQVETVEKNPLPGKDAIEAEAEHNKFKEGIEKFDKGNLSHADTVEKNTLPTKEVIDQEKKAN